MSKQVLQGTLDLMVLRTLETMGPQHGFGLAKRILQVSEGILDLNQGTLYPALLRLEQREAEHRSRGLSPDAARRAARLDIGAITRVTEAYRDQHRIPVVETAWRNVRFGLRSLMRTPAVTMAVVLTLALGIGANAAIFTVVNGVLLKPLPYPQPNALVAVTHGMTG